MNTLGEELQSRYALEADFRQWLEQSKENLSHRAGEGLRIKV